MYLIRRAGYSLRWATQMRSMAPRNSALPHRNNIHEAGVLRGSFARAGICAGVAGAYHSYRYWLNAQID